MCAIVFSGFNLCFCDDSHRRASLHIFSKVLGNPLYGSLFSFFKTVPYGWHFHFYGYAICYQVYLLNSGTATRVQDSYGKVVLIFLYLIGSQVHSHFRKSINYLMLDILEIDLKFKK